MSVIAGLRVMASRRSVLPFESPLKLKMGGRDCGPKDVQKGLFTWFFSRSVSFSGCVSVHIHLGEVSARSIANALRRDATKLRLLNLTNSPIGDSGARALAGALAGNSLIERLWLKNTQLTASGAGALAAGLSNSGALAEIVLSHNAIGDRGAAALAFIVPELRSLAVLSLDSCGITVVGARALMSGMRRSHHSQMLSLSLSGNSAAAVAMLSEQLRARHSTPLGNTAQSSHQPRSAQRVPTLQHQSTSHDSKSKIATMAAHPTNASASVSLRVRVPADSRSGWIRRYAAFHRSQRHSAGARFLVFQCHHWQSMCGGFGNRIHTIIFLLRAAAAWNRILLIDWRAPVPLEVHLEPNLALFDWRPTATERSALSDAGWKGNADSLPLLLNGGPLKQANLAGPWNTNFTSGAARFVRATGMVWYSLPCFGGEPYTCHGGIKEGSHSMLSPCFSALFQPSTMLATQTQQWLNSTLGIAHSYNSIHIRMGDTSSGNRMVSQVKTGRDLRLAPEHAVHAIMCAVTGNDLPLFVATDNSALRDALTVQEPEQFLTSTAWVSFCGKAPWTTLWACKGAVQAAFRRTLVQNCSNCMSNAVTSQDFSLQAITGVFVDAMLLARSEAFYSPWSKNVHSGSTGSTFADVVAALQTQVGSGVCHSFECGYSQPTCPCPKQEACPLHAITHRSAYNDGFGAHFIGMLGVVSYARAVGQPYCHTSWRIVDGSWDNYARGTEGKRMRTAQELFHWVGGTLYGTPAHTSTVNISDIATVLSQPRWWPPAVTRAPQMRSLMRNSSNSMQRAARNFYFAGAVKPPLKWYADGAKHIAVHIRMGDARGQEARILAPQLVVRCIQHVIGAIGADASVHIFSEGKRADFAYLWDNVTKPLAFHLSEEPLTTFHHMVAADALVVAKSTFSLAAAFLSTNRFFFPRNSGANAIGSDLVLIESRMERC
jgi:hypothetical protein